MLEMEIYPLLLICHLMKRLKILTVPMVTQEKLVIGFLELTKLEKKLVSAWKLCLIWLLIHFVYMFSYNSGEKLCFSNGIQQRIPFNVIATQESCSYGAIGRVAFCQKGTNRWFTSLSIKITSNSCPKTITELTNYTLTCKNNNKDCSTADPSLVIFEPESFVELEVNIESRTASQMR